MPPIPLRAPPEVTVWARGNVLISARQGTARPGFYDVAKTPYIAEPLRAICDRDVRRVVLCFGSQTGKTQALIVGLAWLWRFAPGPTMIVQPAIDEAKTFGETRVKPTLEDSPDLKALVPRDRRAHWQKAFYALRGSLVYLIGAGSPSKMASKPCRYTVLDETDKFPPEFTSEGDPIKLIEQRTKTYSGRQKELFTSTPTTEGGVIWREFLKGDRRRLFVRCERCGHWQPLAFADVRFDAGDDKTPGEIAATARLVCRACGAPHDNAAKDRMVAAGEWRAEGTAQVPGVRSYQLPSFAAPWVSLGYVVAHFIEAKRAGRTQLRAFVNGELAEPWVADYEDIAGADLGRLELDYARGESFPAADPAALGERVRIVGVDVQIDRLVAVCREFAPGGESGLVDLAEPETFDGLLRFIDDRRAQACLIDARYRTKEVLDFAARIEGVIPAYGSARLGGALHRTAYLDRAGGKARSGDRRRQIATVTYDQSRIFDLVADGISGKGAGWWLFRGAAADPRYATQVTAKRPIAGLWQTPPGKDDHFGDAEKLAMLGALLLGLLNVL